MKVFYYFVEIENIIFSQKSYLFSPLDFAKTLLQALCSNFITQNYFAEHVKAKLS